MSIIQTIRDKGAKISVALIALALVGFILTDYFSGRGRNLFSGGSTTVGSVNGKKIEYEDFKKKVDLNQANTENMYKQQGMPAPPTARLTKDAVDQAWNQEVALLLLKEEFSRIGMQVGKKERGDVLYGPNAPSDIKQAGTDPNTGQYDPIRAKQLVDQKQRGSEWTQQQKNDFNIYLNSLYESRLRDKYISLFTNSINFPRWFVEKQASDNAQVGKVSLVRMLYTDSSFVDSTIKITDKEIQDHINKNKDRFKQEKTRSISYVTFSASPTKADTAAAKEELIRLKPEFDTTQDVANFVASNGTTESPNIYYKADQLPPSGKDSILRLSKNGVFGPYLEGGTFLMMKLLDTKVLPDSIKCRHIIVSTDVQNGGVDDNIASQKVDSIINAIKGGATWEAMAKMYNSDGTKDTKGEMTFATSTIQSGMENGGFAKEFGQFILWDGKPGQTKKVKTSFGWHYIEILSFMNPIPQYKITYLAKEVRASQQTDNEAEQSAIEFFGEKITDLATFDAAYAKAAKPKGGIKGTAINIRPLDAVVNGITGPMTSRTFVANIYKAKLGEVLTPDKVDDNYVVAIVTEVNEEGTMSVAKARPMVEELLRRKKKAGIIKQKLGNITTLEAAAAALGKPIEIIDSVKMNISFTNSLSSEPKVQGAIFNPANKGKVVTEAIEGTGGVYVIRVESTAATASLEGSVEDQRKAKAQDAQRSQPGPMEGLRKAAKIKDKRADRF